MTEDKAQEMLKKLLKTGAGQKALHQLLVPEQQQEIQRTKPVPRIAVLMPSYKQAHPLTFSALQQMVVYSRQFADVYVPVGISSSVVHWSRNMMIAALYQSGQSFDYVLFVDDDMTFEPDALMRLLGHKKDIVGGLCVRRQDPPMPTIRHLGKDLRYSTIVRWDPKETLMEVDATGTGFMLISRAAIDSIGEYYLRCGFERQTFGRMFNAAARDHEATTVVEGLEVELGIVEKQRRDHYRHGSNAFWFQFLNQLTGEGEYGEDISFCLKAKLVGLPIYVDNTVTPGHVGDYVYTVNDYLEYQGDVVKDSDK